MTYSDINIRQYQQIRDILDEGLSDVETQAEIMAILFNKTADEILDLPVDKYRRMSEQVRFLLDSPQPKGEVPKKLRIDGIRYRIIQSAKDMTAGQFIDYQQYVKAGADANLHNILSTILIPWGREYNKGYDITETQASLREHLDLQTAVNIAFFLRRRQSKSLRRTLYYLEALTTIRAKTGGRKIRETMRSLKGKIRTALSHRNGDG